MARSLRSRGKGDDVRVDVKITQDDLRDLVRAINKHGDAKAVRKQLRTGLREAVKPLVPQARSAVRSQPGGKRSTGLRKDMARAVQVKVDLGLRSQRIGVRLRLDGRKLRDRPAGLVAAYEGTRPWRHPVFGNRERWVTQPHRGFLTEVATRNTPTVGRKIEQTMADIGRHIDKG